jgi:hypothetical protein
MSSGQPGEPLIPVQSSRIRESQANIQTILDATFNPAVGQTLVRGQNGWAAGAGSGSGTPGGTAGQFQYNSAGTSFAGSPNFSFDATNGTPQFTPISAPASPAVGDQWFDSTAGGIVTCRFVDGSGNRLITMNDGTFYRTGPCANVNNTTGASLLGSPTSVWGSLVIPGGSLKAGQWIEAYFQAQIGVVNSGSNFFAIGLRMLATNAVIQNVAVSTGTAFVITTASLQTYGPAVMNIISTGASGSVNGSGNAVIVQSGTASVALPMATTTAGTIETSVDFTVANTMDLFCQWAPASASNTITLQNLRFALRG